MVRIQLHIKQGLHVLIVWRRHVEAPDRLLASDDRVV
jgi:hypothetical protein